MIPCPPFPTRARSARPCMSTSLTNAQIRFLRGQAHGLKAMLQLGAKGLTDAVVAEVELALEHHELIKVKVAAEDREARDAMIAALAERSGAVYITRNGEVVAKLVPHRGEPDTRTPTRRLLDRIAGLTHADTGWADELAETKRAEIEVQDDNPWE